MSTQDKYMNNLRGTRTKELRPEDRANTDKRTTMPKGGYSFGLSNPRLRPNVPKGA